MENRGPLIVVVVVLAGFAAGSYYYSHRAEPEAPAPSAIVEQASPPAEPEIRYPLQTPEADAAKPLPPLAESDAAVQQALTGLIDKSSLQRFFNLDAIVHRLVVLIDNLAQKKIPQQHNLMQPVAGKFAVTGRDENLTLNPENYRRYTPYVQLAQTIDVKKLVAMYLYFYPLIQEEYKNIGSTKQYFNDRLVVVIDDLLAAPEPTQPIKLVKPKVFYEFADPALEQLSAGQKTMIRMGGENAAKVKATLREIRREITTPRSPK